MDESVDVLRDVPQLRPADYLTVTCRCYCGAVRLGTVAVQPLIKGFCSCTNCKRWSGTQLASACYVAPEELRVLHGEENLSLVSLRPSIIRCFCRVCGSPMMHRTAQGVAIHTGTFENQEILKDSRWDPAKGVSIHTEDQTCTLLQDALEKMGAPR